MMIRLQLKKVRALQPFKAAAFQFNIFSKPNTSVPAFKNHFQNAPCCAFLNFKFKAHISLPFLFFSAFPSLDSLSLYGKEISIQKLFLHFLLK